MMDTLWLYLMVLVVFLMFLVIMGKNEIKLKLSKMMGGFRGRIVAKELRKDGKVYTYRAKIKNQQVKLEDRTYDYNIKNTAINNNDLREAYFSEVAGRQINPYARKDINEKGDTLSPDTISEMLQMATLVAFMPKPGIFNMKSLPIMGIIILIILLFAFLGSA